MKRIRALQGPTPGLQAYCAEAAGDGSWEGFRSFQGSTDAYWELAEALEAQQHGLCGYCEVALHPRSQHRRNRQVEHFRPRSSHRDAALDYANLIACCTGAGSPPETNSDQGGRRRRSRYVSCGSAKGDAPSENLLDPRHLPATPSVFRVLIDGSIEADLGACELVGIDVSTVERTIDVLGLNIPRLRSARERRWSSLRDSMDERLSEAEQVRASAELELLPDQEDRLPGYFTTARSFFYSRTDIVDDLLGEAPQRWV